MKYVLIVTGFILAASCASMDPKQVNDTTIRRSPEAVKVAIDLDQLLLRQDLVRATHTELQMVGSGDSAHTEEVEVINPYSHVVLDFGNGIVLDSNSNLAFDIARYYGLAKAKKLTIVEKALPGTYEAPRSWEKSGDQYFVKRGDNILELAQQSGDQTLYTRKGFLIDDRTTVVKSPDRFVVSGKILMFDSIQEIRQLSPTAASLPVALKTVTYNLVDPNTVRAEPSFELSKTNDTLVITMTRGFGLKDTYTLVKTDKGILFFTKKGSQFDGFEVQKIDNAIKVFENGKLSSEFAITAFEN